MAKKEKENKQKLNKSSFNQEEGDFLSQSSASREWLERDDFDRKYRRAVAESAFPTERLLNDLSRESRADKYNFLGAFVPAVLIIILALSFVLISRGDIEELFTVRPSLKTLLDGSYTENLNYVYESTLPFSESIKKAGAALGFCESPVSVDENTVDTPSEDQAPESPEDVVSDVPEVTAPVVTTTEPEITTTPPATEEPVPTTTEETEPEVYDTYTMYASATLNVRFGPSTEDAILGYYNQNDPVQVIEIMDDGWAAVLFDGHKAYAHSNYLSKKKVEVTTRKKTTEATTTQESEVTDTPDENGDPEVTLQDEPIDTPETGSEQTYPEDEPSPAEPEDDFPVTESGDDIPPDDVE